MISWPRRHHLACSRIRQMVTNEVHAVYIWNHSAGCTWEEETLNNSHVPVQATRTFELVRLSITISITKKATNSMSLSQVSFQFSLHDGSNNLCVPSFQKPTSTHSSSLTPPTDRAFFWPLVIINFRKTKRSNYERISSIFWPIGYSQAALFGGDYFSKKHNTFAKYMHIVNRSSSSMFPLPALWPLLPSFVKKYFSAAFCRLAGGSKLDKIPLTKSDII